MRTGERRWTFHNPPEKGELGYETWENGAAEYTGNANVWTNMSADPELGLVYLPFGTPTNDWYGGHRLGDDLFAESIVCVRAATGERVWHYQLIHHGLWDWDIPAAPKLFDATIDGKPAQGDRGAHQAGLRLHLRSRHRRADLADRGAPGAAVRRARRARFGDAALPHQAAARSSTRATSAT